MPLGWQWQLHVSIQKVWKIHFVGYRIPLLLEPWRVSWSWSSGEKTQNYKHLATTTWCKIKREKHLATRALGALLAPTSAGQATAPEAFVLQVFFYIFLIIWNRFVLKCDFLKICLAICSAGKDFPPHNRANTIWKVWRKLSGQKPCCKHLLLQISILFSSPINV